MLGDRSEVAIQLRVPVREVAPVGEVFDLIDEAASQAAGVDFLQRDDVVVRNQVADRAAGCRRAPRAAAGVSIRWSDIAGIGRC